MPWDAATARRSRSSSFFGKFALDLQVGSKLYSASVASTFKIAEVARRSGFNASTLRYYEDRGLVPPAYRTASGYRLYDEAVLQRLAFISRAKQLGCSLEEISGLIAVWERDRCEPVQTRLRELVATKIADAQTRIAELAALSAQLQQAAAVLDGHTPDGPCDDNCGCSTPDAGMSPAPTAVALTTKPSRGDGTAVACTLGASDMAGRIRDWQTLLASATAREPLDGGVRVAFPSGTPVGPIAELVAAEQACCVFFHFALTVDDRGVALEVTAPAEAGDVVYGLFGAPS